jgi:hypothetical protein
MLHAKWAARHEVDDLNRDQTFDAGSLRDRKAADGENRLGWAVRSPHRSIDMTGRWPQAVASGAILRLGRPPARHEAVLAASRPLAG